MTESHPDAEAREKMRQAMADKHYRDFGMNHMIQFFAREDGTLGYRIVPKEDAPKDIEDTP